MIRYLYLLALLFCTAATAFGQVAGEGRSFVLTLPHGSIANQYTLPLGRLLLTSEAGTRVQILHTATGASQSVFIAPGGSEEVILDSSIVMAPPTEGTHNNTIQLSSPEPITAALLLDRQFASEAYAAIPDTMLGFEYMVPGVHEVEEGSSIEGGSIITVIGIHDDTRVTITPSVGTLARPAGVPFTITLDRGEAHQILTDPFVDVDFTGTTVLADKPCGVVSGAACADFNFGVEHRCNPLMEQLPHVDAWGTLFVVAPFHRQDVGLFRILARCDNTVITIRNNEVIATLNRGEVHQVLLDAVYRVSASQPVLMAQMVTSTSRGLQDRSVAYGDPSMTIVPPVEQYGQAYRVHLPPLTARQDAGSPVGWRHYMHIMFDAAAEPGLLLDGAPPTWLSRAVQGPLIVGIAEVGLGRHEVNATLPVGVITYGYTVSDAYGFSPGNVVRPYKLEAPNLHFSACPSTFDTTITVVNSGAGNVTVEAVSFEGNVEGDLIAPALPFTLSPGESREVTIRFRNVGSTDRRGYVIFSGGACRSRLMAVEVEIGTALLVLAPVAGSSVDFGIVPPALPSADRIVTITNTGTGPVTIAPPDISPAEFTIVSPSFPLTLASGASVQVTIRYTPTENGRDSGSFVVHILGCADSQRVALVGEKRNGGYFEALLPPPLRLLCPPKLPDTLELEITNQGDLPLDLSGGKLTGAAEGDFTLLTSLAGMVIQPGDTLKVKVLYTPGAPGMRDVALEVTSNAINGSTFFIPFDVRNDTLIVETNVTLLDFGTVSGCDMPPVLEIALVNSGTAPVSAFTARFDNPANGRSTPSSGTIDPGDTLRLRVELAAGATGQLRDSLRITIPECDQAIAIPVRADLFNASVSFARDTLDFGGLALCETMRELRIDLRNDGDLPDTVFIDYLPSQPEIEVEFIPAADPLIIQPGERLELVVRYRPDPGGPLADSITIIAQPCGIPRTLHLRGSIDSTRPSLSDTTIDFGDVIEGTSARRSVWVVNRTDVPYRVAPGAIVSNVGTVRIVAPIAEVEIAPGDSLEVELEYAAGAAGDTLRGSFTLPFAPCPDTFHVTFRGVALDDPTRLLFRWVDASAAVGEEVRLRLMVEQIGAAITTDTLVLNTSVRFNATVLVPLSLESAGPAITARILGERLDGDERVMTMEIRGLFPVNGPLAELRGITALGSTDSTWIDFDSVTATRASSGAAIGVSDTIPGLFRVLGICRIGSARLISVNGLLRLGTIHPNPAAGMAAVEFETIEQGRTMLVLHDMRGSTGTTLLDVDLAPGVYRAEIDTRSLPSGIYMLQLRTPSQVVQQKMVVKK